MDNTLHASKTLQSPGVLPWSSPVPDLGLNLYPKSAVSDCLADSIRLLRPLAIHGNISPVTSKSEPDEFSGMPLSSKDQKHFCSMRVGLQEARDCVPPDHRLPPTADIQRQHERVPGEPGGGPSTKAGTCMFDSLPTFPLEAQDSMLSQGGPERPVCDVCRLNVASKGSFVLKDKHCDWATFACRFCVKAVCLQRKITMIPLRGRCLCCPRSASFAPPGCPQHISIHCKKHKLEGEVNRATRLCSATAGGQSWPKLLDLDSGSQNEDSLRESDMEHLLRMDDGDSDTRSLSSASERWSSCERSAAAPLQHKVHTCSGAAAAQSTQRRSPIVDTGVAANYCIPRGRSISMGAITLRANARRMTVMDSSRSNSCGSWPLEGHMCRVRPQPPAAGWAQDTASSNALLWQTHDLQGRGAVEVKKRCRAKGCEAMGAFGSTRDGIASWCRKHKGSGQVRLLPQQKGSFCAAKGCSTRASFGEAGQGVARFCASHKLSWHINVRAVRCASLDCQGQPSYGPPSARRPSLCVKHRGRGDVEVRSTRRNSPGRNSMLFGGALLAQTSSYLALTERLLTITRPPCAITCF